MKRALGKVRAASVDWIKEVIGEGEERMMVRHMDRTTVEARCWKELGTEGNTATVELLG